MSRNPYETERDEYEAATVTGSKAPAGVEAHKSRPHQKAVESEPKFKRFERAKSMAEGRWASIMSALWPECRHALNDAYISRKVHVTCPRHGTKQQGDRKGDGFRFYQDFHKTGGGICNTCGGANNGVDLLSTMLGISSLNALEMVEHHLGIAKDYTGPKPKLPPRRTTFEEPVLKKEELENRIEILEKIWSLGIPFADLPDEHHAMLYFMQTRGITSPEFLRRQDNLRYNPELLYMTGNRSQYFPGIVGLFESSDGRALGVHRTFLDRELPVKASVPKPKLMLKKLNVQMNGGVLIKSIMPMTSHLSIGEGIETAASVAFAIGRPVLAATTGTLLAGWKPIPGIKSVTIWSDSDSSGAGANYAITLKHRLEELGLRVRILEPSRVQSLHGDTRDWNDVLLSDGVDPIISAYEGREPVRSIA